MRLFLLPISTRRTLIYCERAAPSLAPGASKPPLADRIITKSNALWTSWESAEKGWQKKVTEYGNALFRRIPFEEWGLKTLPPGTKRNLEGVGKGEFDKVECLYPGGFLEGHRVGSVLERLAVERQGLHRRALGWCLVGMPVTLPFAAVPVVPNLPFFYLCFRAYSHYRAWYGGGFLAHLTRHNLVKHSPSPQLDALYATGLLHPTRQAAREASAPTAEDIERVSREVKVLKGQAEDDVEEVMVLRKWNGKVLAEAFGLPEMEVEIERAVEQVEKRIGEERKVREEERRAAAGGEKEKEKDS